MHLKYIYFITRLAAALLLWWALTLKCSRWALGLTPCGKHPWGAGTARPCDSPGSAAHTGTVGAGTATLGHCRLPWFVVSKSPRFLPWNILCLEKTQWNFLKQNTALCKFDVLTHWYFKACTIHWMPPKFVVSIHQKHNLSVSFRLPQRDLFFFHCSIPQGSQWAATEPPWSTLWGRGRWWLSQKWI